MHGRGAARGDVDVSDRAHPIGSVFHQRVVFPGVQVGRRGERQRGGVHQVR